MVRPRIYVAGPLSADSHEEMEQNVRVAIDAGMGLIRRGYSPFIPHLDYYTWRQYPNSLDYETFMELDAPWIHVSDAMYVIAESPGVLREVELAKELQLPVYYSISEVPDRSAP